MGYVSSSPHVLIFPLPFQGHVTPMLHLAELLCLANLKVTFLNSIHNHQLLTRCADIEARFARYPGFRFKAISDGLPDDHPRTGDENVKDWLKHLVQGLAIKGKPFLREMLFGTNNTAPEVTCLILDGWISFAYEVANEAEIPVVAFRCLSACCMSAYFCIPTLIEAGEVPFKESQMDIHGKNPRCLIYIDSEMKHQVLPHVLIVPLPVQGHVTPMLNLAELFCLANLKVTFINSTHNHQRLTRNTDIEARFACYPGFSFRAISDGLPDDHPRNGEDGCKDLIEGFTSNVQPQFKEILSGSSSTNGLANTKDATPVTCLILDGWLSFAYDAAIEAEIPVIAFRCYSACCTWVFSCMAALIETGEIPFKDDDEGMDRHVKNVPGMDNFLRCRDLPSFCRVKDTSSCHDLQQMFAGETKRTEETYALIVNTFEDLEGPILNQIRKRCSKVYSIGPLHAHLKYKLHLAETTSSINSSSSLWEVDRSCISWLDHKPDKAVVYVSFGSLATLKKEQLMEIWAGLVQSKKYFLWVVRSNLIKGSDSDTPTPAELLEGTEERGCMVSWAPQEEVLAHRAIGGFMTHSGWNSTLESIIAGVPMLCWPYFADQQVNSRYVSEVWRIGLDMKDKCDRNIVEKMINDLMDERKEELQRAMAKMSNLANESIAKGGSSYCNLEHLIEDIKAMSVNDVQ